VPFKASQVGVTLDLKTRKRFSLSPSHHSRTRDMPGSSASLLLMAAMTCFSGASGFQASNLLAGVGPRAPGRRDAALCSTKMMGYPPGMSYEPLPGAGSAPSRAGSMYGQPRFSTSSHVPSPAALRGNTRLFLDTADEKAWGELMPLGLFYGITTNPVLLEKAGVECSVKIIDALSASAFAVGAEEFMCQAWGQTVSELVGIGGDLQKLDPRVVVKMPLTAEGIAAANLLSRRGGRICMTACYTPHQASFQMLRSMQRQRRGGEEEVFAC